MAAYATILESIFSADPGLVIPVVLFISIGLVAIVKVVAHHFRTMHLAEMEMALKQDMVARGFSADEIEKVIRAGGKPPENPPAK